MAKIQGINIPKSEHDKNYIINGDMRIAQRGTSFPAIAGSTYSLDRWTNINNTSAVFTITQDTDVPTAGQAGYLFQNSLKVDITTADASVAAGDRVQIRQIIEGYNWVNIAQKKFTISFWVKATKTGTYCISLVNNGSDRSYVAEYTVNSTLTWEYKTITILASPSAGGWNYTNSVGIVLSWTLMAGTNFNTTPGAWQTGNLHSTSNQVNSMDSTSNDFWLTGVMVNEGAVAAPFSMFGKDAEGELAACQRYFEKSYELATAPGTAATAGMDAVIQAASGGLRIIKSVFKVRKRTIPTVTSYSPATGASGQVRNGSDALDQAAGFINLGETGFINATNVGVDKEIQWQWTAASEL